MSNALKPTYVQWRITRIFSFKNCYKLNIGLNMENNITLGL